MPNVTLTTFVDFVSATGTARVTRVRNAKIFYAQDYAPERDFYKQLRERIEACFDDGWDATALKHSLADVTDAKKVANYEECRKGLTKWVGRKQITPKREVRSNWTSSSLHVAVNPELHADVNGKPHLIKLYFKGDQLSKQKADVALHLLDKAAPRGTTVGVLDVRRARLLVPTRTIQGMDALLNAEAAAFVSLWNSL